MELSQNDSNSNNNNNQVCSYLGGQLENYCIEFLAEYTDDIIDMLVKGHKQMTRIMYKMIVMRMVINNPVQVNQYLNPDEICKAIAACP